jgi:hypothetical protein
MKRQEALRYRESIEQAAALQSDEKALENIYLYPSWKEGLSVKVDERYRYGDTLYKCVQAHTTQADWTPDITPALWVVVSLDEWPEWVQPTGAQDAYAKDAKVSHNGKHWISDVDANVWEPSVYGWTESVSG